MASNSLLSPSSLIPLLTLSSLLLSIPLRVPHPISVSSALNRLPSAAGWRGGGGWGATLADSKVGARVGWWGLEVMMAALGKTRWAIAEGYIPSKSNGPSPEMTSHETACILNTSEKDAHVRIMVYFKDRDPAGPYQVTVPARRTLHLRFNELEDPEKIPFDTDYASVFESDVPIIVQHTRLDSRQAANALMTTMAFGGE